LAVCLGEQQGTEQQITFLDGRVGETAGTPVKFPSWCERDESSSGIAVGWIAVSWQGYPAFPPATSRSGGVNTGARPLPRRTGGNRRQDSCPKTRLTDGRVVEFHVTETRAIGSAGIRLISS
jgi:hypothetical protein